MSASPSHSVHGMSNMSDHYGNVHTHGLDIKSRLTGTDKIEREWSQAAPATKVQGYSLLDQLEADCVRSERDAREHPFEALRKRIATLDYDVSGSGIPLSKQFYPRGSNALKIRVDFEIWAGRAWKP